MEKPPLNKVIKALEKKIDPLVPWKLEFDAVIERGYSFKDGNLEYYLKGKEKKLSWCSFNSKYSLYITDLTNNTSISYDEPEHKEQLEKFFQKVEEMEEKRTLQKVQSRLD